MNEKFDEMTNFCVDLFGADKVSRTDFHDPEAVEITVRPDSQIGPANLAMYDGTPKQFFMHIGQFSFEYDNEIERFEFEARKYLTALAQGKIKIEKKSFLGIKVSEKLLIKE